MKETKLPMQLVIILAYALSKIKSTNACYAFPNGKWNPPRRFVIKLWWHDTTLKTQIWSCNFDINPFHYEIYVNLYDIYTKLGFVLHFYKAGKYFVICHVYDWICSCATFVGGEGSGWYRRLRDNKWDRAGCLSLPDVPVIRSGKLDKARHIYYVISFDIIFLEGPVRSCCKTGRVMLIICC